MCRRASFDGVGHQSHRSEPHHPLLRGKRLLIVVVCVASVIASFSSGLLDLDSRVTDWLRENRTGQYTDTALMLTALGSTPVAIGMLAIGTVFLLAKRFWSDLLFLMLSVVGGTQLNSPLKDLFDRPRPIFPDQSLTFNGSGFPSGHAMTATVLCAALALILANHESRRSRRVAAAGVAATLVAVVAATRVYLGAHYLTDVVGGIAFGLMWLMVADATSRWAADSRRGR